MDPGHEATSYTRLCSTLPQLCPACRFDTHRQRRSDERISHESFNGPIQLQSLYTRSIDSWTGLCSGLFKDDRRQFSSCRAIKAIHQYKPTDGRGQGWCCSHGDGCGNRPVRSQPIHSCGIVPGIHPAIFDTILYDSFKVEAATQFTANGAFFINQPVTKVSNTVLGYSYDPPGSYAVPANIC
jgi:hypothetical protein